MRTNLDGSVEYHTQDGDVFSAVTLNGYAVADLVVTDAKIYPDGYGYVVTRKELGDADKILRDYHSTPYSNGLDAEYFYYTDRVNVPLNFFYHGKIEVTL